MFIRGFAVAVMLGVIATACGSGAGPETSTGSEQQDEVTAETEGQAIAEVEGLPDGCAALMAIDLREVPDTESTEGWGELIADLEIVLEGIEGESEPATAFLVAFQDLSALVLDTLEGDREIGVEESLLSFEQVAIIEDNEDEAMAFFESRCGSSTFSSLLGGTVGSGSAANQAAPETTTIPPEPIPVDTVIDTTSVGLAATYANVEFELGEIWRTNQEPVDALTNTGEGTEDSWVLVEVRGTNTGGSDFGSLRQDSFIWIDSNGDATPPEMALTPQGEQWNIAFPDSSSERGFLVFPGTVGDTGQATLRVAAPGALPLVFSLGQTQGPDLYPVELATGTAASTVSDVVGACGFNLATEVRSAEVGVNALLQSGWRRVDDGLRYVVIDLAITPTDLDSNSTSCRSAAFFSTPLVEARLELNNGDKVASIDLDIDIIDRGETRVLPLTFEIADDVTSFALVGIDGEELGSWEGFALPAVE